MTYAQRRTHREIDQKIFEKIFRLWGKFCLPLNAPAFTHGNNIWLERGESQIDLGLIAHELTREVNAD